MASYRLSNQAALDLERIYRRGLREFGEQQADGYFARLFEQFESIAEHPLLSQAVEHIRPGYRRRVCGVDSIYYRVIERGEAVEIVAIIGQQDIDAWL